MTKLVIKLDDLLEFEPITANQKKAWDSWYKDNDNIALVGSAGTGKTFIGLYFALEAALQKNTPFHQVILVRSVVPTREIGFLPGSISEKVDVYQAPYKNICDELFHEEKAYQNLINAHVLDFETTSYIRGKTFDNAIILVDEMQNLNFHELDSVITRMGKNSRIIFCGDYLQSDFTNEGEREGVNKFLNVMDHMKNFNTVRFTWDDIVRSDFVRDYIMTKEMLNIR